MYTLYMSTNQVLHGELELAINLLCTLMHITILLLMAEVETLMAVQLVDQVVHHLLLRDADYM